MVHYPGNYSKALRISSSNVLKGNLKAIPVEKITNGLVVELVTLGKLQRQPWDAILKWLEQLHGKNWPQIQPLKLTLVKTHIPAPEASQVCTSKEP